MTTYDLTVEIQYGDTVSVEQLEDAMRAAARGVHCAITPFTFVSKDEHGAHNSVSWVFQVDVEQQFHLQYVERAIENLVRVALGGIIVRVSTSTSPAQHQPDTIEVS